MFSIKILQEVYIYTDNPPVFLKTLCLILTNYRNSSLPRFYKGCENKSRHNNQDANLKDNEKSIQDLCLLYFHTTNDCQSSPLFINTKL